LEASLLYHLQPLQTELAERLNGRWAFRIFQGHLELGCDRRQRMEEEISSFFQLGVRVVSIKHHKTCEFNAFHTDSGGHFEMGSGAFARLARAFAAHARSHHTESGTAGFSTRARCSLVKLLVRRESLTQ